MLVGRSGKPSAWSTWWIIDGGDDAETLHAADVKGSLNMQVETVQQNFKQWVHFFSLIVDNTACMFICLPACIMEHDIFHGVSISLKHGPILLIDCGSCRTCASDPLHHG